MSLLNKDIHVPERRELLVIDENFVVYTAAVSPVEVALNNTLQDDCPCVLRRTVSRDEYVVLES